MKKRLLSALLFVCLLLTLFPAAAMASETASGECGENLTWTLSGGKLTVRGTGAMTNYKDEDGNRPPWYDSKDKIVSVTLESGVTEVGALAFRECANLTSVSLPNTLKTIRASSFALCSKLDNVKIPDSVTTIYGPAFWGTGLREVTIPANVTSISSTTFGSCANLTAIKVADGNKSFSVLGGVLYNKGKTQLVCYPAGKSNSYYQIPSGVTEIQNYAFFRAKLTAAYLRNGVTKIGKYVFANCSELERIYLPKFTTLIDEHAFSGCGKLKTVAIPKTVTEIANHAFEKCDALENAYYAGSESDWKKVKIGEENDSVSSAVKFNSPTYTLSVVAVDNKRSQSFDGTERLPNKTLYETAPNPPTGYRFKEWVGLSGLELKNGTNAETPEVSFTMPAKNLTLTAQYVPQFDDVPEGSYFYAPVYWAVEKGITNGTTDTTFSPHNTCTTAQILTFLWRANNSPEPTAANPFSDLSESAYYAKAARWAYEKNMISGKTFDANAPCTRAASMKYMWILAGSPKNGKLPFKDVNPKADYAWAVVWAVERGITNGTSETTFNPDGICTRAQIVTFLHRHYA